MVSQKESIFQYLAGRDENYEKLERLMKTHEKLERLMKTHDTDPTANLDVVNAELNECVNTIQLRQGSLGVIRKQTVSYMLKKIVEKLVPSHLKYLVFSCIKENGYYARERGRKLAKAYTSPKHRGKYEEQMEKFSDPDFIWKEVVQVL